MNLVLATDRDKGAAAKARPALRQTPSFKATVELGAEGRLLACIDDGPASRAILDQAMAVADALDLAVTAARVIETPHTARGPADPLEWQVRRRESLERFEHIVAVPARPMERVMLAGSAADELTGWASDNGASVLVLGTHAAPGDRRGLGGTAHSMIQRATASVLLVPGAGSARLPYRRLMVPLDGSTRAESVLPIAVRIARASGAELMLTHVVSRPEAIGGPGDDGAARALCLRLEEQNELDARQYLSAIEARIWNEGLPVRSVVSGDGDARVELVRLVHAHQADLVIVASHGRSGIVDVPCGSVTEYLATHAPAPLLIVRPGFHHGFAAPVEPLDQGFFGPAPEQG